MALPQDILDDIDVERTALQEIISQPMTDPVGAAPSIATVQGAETMRTSGPLRQEYSDLENVPSQNERNFVDARTTQEAYRYLPESASPQRQSSGGFDWARALTALGGGDVGAIDANRRYADQAGMRDVELQGKRAELADREMQRSQARSLLDPNSEVSKAAAQDYAQYLYNLAEAPGIGKLADEFRNQAWQAQGKRASEINRMKASTDSLYGNIIKAVSTQNNAELAGKKLGLAERQAEATEKMSGQKFNLDVRRANEEERHNRANEANAGRARYEAQMSKLPPGMTQKLYEQSAEAEQIADAALAILDGKQIRWTGIGGEKLNSFFSGLPKALDARNDKEVVLGNLLGMLSAEELHDFYGAVIPKTEMAKGNQFIPSANQNEATLRQSLNRVRTLAAQRRKKTESLYPILSAERSTPTDPGQKPLKAPAGKVAGDRLRHPVDKKIYVVQPDLTMRPE